MSTGHVIFLVTDFKVGGAQTQIIEIGSRLRQRGWRVGVVSMVPPVALTAELERAGLPVVDLGMRLGVPDPRGVLRLARLLRREHPDVLHCQLVHANLLGRLARALAPVPALVCTAQNVVEGGRVLEWGYRVTDRWADLTTQVCEAGAERYRRNGAVPAGKLLVVPNAVDTTRFRPPEAPRAVKGPFAWLAAGRLEEQKDHATLLRAFRTLRDRDADATLRIAGDGPLRGELVELVERLELGGAVEFLGPRSDLPELMRAADGFVSSSAWEGLPLVLLEAAASALPIVATDVGGTRDIVRDPEGGLLVPPGDPGALSEGMLRMMGESPDERARVGQRARERARLHFDVERVVDRWEEIYRDLLAR